MLDITTSLVRILRESIWILGDSLFRGSHPKIPLCSNAITPEWLSKVLQPHTKGAHVQSVQPVYEESGTTTHLRISITYNKTRENGHLPKTLFLKLAPRDIPTRLFGSLYNLNRNEARFYSEVSPIIESLVPKIYHAGSARHGSKSVILMEDLTEDNYYTKDITNPCTLKEAQMVVQALGQIHGRFWESPRFKEDLAWLMTYETDKNIRLNRLLRKKLIPRVITQFGEWIPESVKASGKLIVDHFDILEKQWTQPPHTLLHGDAHLGNLYFGKQNVGFLDWQVVRRGQGMRDVTYFIIFSVPRDLRQKHEKELIRMYLESLTAEGISVPCFEEAWTQYRLHYMPGMPSYLL